MQDPRCHQNDQYLSRRDWLLHGGAGFGALALTGLLQGNLRAAETAAKLAKASSNPLANKTPHFAAKAKSVIFLFMEGGPSHLDTFDPKPKVNELAGKPLPDSVEEIVTAMGEFKSPLLASKRQWAQHGQSGLWVSDWLPHIATCADDIAVIRSCWADGINHSTGVCQMNTGSILAGRPCLGSWVTYGLGTVNENLPAFVVMQDNQASVVNGPRNWGAGFMPAVYQGVRLQGSGEPFPNLNPPPGITNEQQAGKLALLKELNKRHAQSRSWQTDLDARINSYELAFRMHSKWDAHSGIEKNHTTLCKASDQPVAGLIKDLKRRGLLDSTLVIWGGEFGRTPMSEKGDGRDHNPTGFSMFMAGGGVKGGQTIGETDDFGLHAVKDRLHVHDLHATILYMLGLDNMGLVYNSKGRPERPTLNEGEAYKKIAG